MSIELCAGPCRGVSQPASGFDFHRVMEGKSSCIIDMHWSTMRGKYCQENRHNHTPEFSVLKTIDTPFTQLPFQFKWSMK